ncbi:hypothetical protein ACW9HJ_04050 [Nocardia gipuzkoensis]
MNNSTIPAGSTADHLEQRSPADRREHTGIDATALTPLAERIREAFDHADRADRFEQAILTPLPDDEYRSLTDPNSGPRSDDDHNAFPDLIADPSRAPRHSLPRHG